MAGQMVHIEIPADDTAAARTFWGSLFGWEFNASPGPFEYHMARLGEQQGGAITNMEPGKRGTRVYFDVEDIRDGAAKVADLGGRAGTGTRNGLVRHLHRPARQRVRAVAARPRRAGTRLRTPRHARQVSATRTAGRRTSAPG